MPSLLLAAQCPLTYASRQAKTDDNGHTPLHLAAMAGSTPLVQMLLDAGSNPAARDRVRATSQAAPSAHAAYHG